MKFLHIKFKYNKGMKTMKMNNDCLKRLRLLPVASRWHNDYYS